MLNNSVSIDIDRMNDNTSLTEKLQQQLTTMGSQLAAQRTLNAKLVAKLQLTSRALQLQKLDLEDIKREMASCNRTTTSCAQCIEERVSQVMHSISKESVGRVQLLQQQVQQLHEDLARQEMHSHATISELQSAHNASQTALNDLQTTFREKQMECEALQERLQNSQHALESLQLEHTSSRANLEAVCDQLRFELQDNRAHLKTQVVKANIAEEQMAKLQEENSNLLAQLSRESELGVTQQQQHDEEMQRLHSLVASKDTEIASLELRRGELEAALANLRDQATQTSLEVNRQRQQKDEQLAALQVQVRELTTRLDSTSAQLVTQQTQINRANESAAKHQSEAQQTRSSLALLESRFWKLTQQADQIREAFATAQSDKNALSAQCSRLEAQLTEAETRRREVAADLERATQEVADLRQQVAQLVQNDELAALQATVDDLRKELDEKIVELERLQQTVISQCAERNSLLDELSATRALSAVVSFPPATVAVAHPIGSSGSTKTGMLSGEERTFPQQTTKSRHRKNSRDSRVVPL